MYDLLKSPINKGVAILKFCYNTQQESDFGEAGMECGGIL